MWKFLLPAAVGCVQRHCTHSFTVLVLLRECAYHVAVPVYHYIYLCRHMKCVPSLHRVQQNLVPVCRNSKQHFNRRVAFLHCLPITQVQLHVLLVFFAGFLALHFFLSQFSVVVAKQYKFLFILNQF